VIQIAVRQFVRKTSAKKVLKSEKNWSPFIPRYAGMRRISTKEKKMIPYKPYVRGKQVESILGIRKNMTKTGFNLNNMVPHSVRLVDPIHAMQCPAGTDCRIIVHQSFGAPWRQRHFVVIKFVCCNQICS
jgi:hypothetical protein